MVRGLEETHGEHADIVIMLGTSPEARRNAVRLGIDDPPHGTYVFTSEGELLVKRGGHAYGKDVVLAMVDQLIQHEAGTTE